MSYRERIHKYIAEKNRLMKSQKWSEMTPSEKDQAIRDLADKWKV